MAASRNDSYVLSADSGFQQRIRSSIVAAAIAINNEGWGVVFHEQRMRFGVSIILSPDSYKTLFATSVATDTSVLADATAAGTLVLTAGNVASQALLVTDAHIDSAVSAQFNSFIVPLSR